MSSKTDYTSQEWTTLLLAPVQAGAAVLLASKSGIVGTAQEMLALYNATHKSAAQRYPNNTLIQSLLSGDNNNEYKTVVQKISTYVKDQSARQQIQSEITQTCRSTASILEQKSTPQEANEYKKWLMDVCTAVANAASEGGQKVSPPEQAAMDTIAQALNTPPSTIV